LRSILSLGSLTSNPKTTRAASVVTPTGNIVATGGTVTTGTDSIGDYKIHTFTSNETFEITQCYEGAKFEILIVGAGGTGSGNTRYQYIVPYPYAGGWQRVERGGGGGGGGGIIYLSNKELSVGQFPVVVGQGQPSKTLYELINIPDYGPAPNWGFQQSPFATGGAGGKPVIDGITGVISTSQMGAKGQSTTFLGFTAEGGWGGSTLYNEIKVPLLLTLPFERPFGPDGSMITIYETRYVYINQLSGNESKNGLPGETFLPVNLEDNLYCENRKGGVGQVNASYSPNGYLGPRGLQNKLYYDKFESDNRPYGFKSSISGTELEYGAGGESFESGLPNIGTPGTGSNGSSDDMGNDGIVIVKYYIQPTSNKIFLSGGKVTADSDYTYHEYNVDYDLKINKVPPDSKFDILISHVGKDSLGFPYNTKFNPGNTSINIIQNQAAEYNSTYSITGLTGAARGKITGVSGFSRPSWSIGQYDTMLYDGKVVSMKNWPHKMTTSIYDFVYDSSNLWTQPIARYVEVMSYKVPVYIKSITGTGAKIWLIFKPFFESDGSLTGRIQRNYFTGEFIVENPGKSYRNYDVWALDYIGPYSGPTSPVSLLTGQITVDGLSTWNNKSISFPQGTGIVPVINSYDIVSKESFDIKLQKYEYSKYIPTKILQTWTANTSIDNYHSTVLEKSQGYQIDWYDENILNLSDYGNVANTSSNTANSNISTYSQYENLQSTTGVTSDFTNQSKVYGYSDKLSQNHFNTPYWWGDANHYVSERRKYSFREDGAKVIIRYKSHIDGYIPEGPDVEETTISGSTLYDTPGTHYWTCPSGVHSVSVVAVGGGGSGGINYPNQRADGGGGGALAWKNNIPVTPGKKYIVKVGHGGRPNHGDYDEYDESQRSPYDPNLILGVYKRPENMPDAWLQIHESQPSIWPAGTGQGGKKSFFLDDYLICAGGGAGGTGGNRSYTLLDGTVKTSPQYYSSSNSISDVLCNDYVNAEQSSKFNISVETTIRNSAYTAFFTEKDYEVYTAAYTKKYGSIPNKLYINRSQGGTWIGDGGANGSNGGVSTQNTAARIVGQGGNYKLSPYEYGINPLDWFNYSGGGGGAGGYGQTGKAGGGSSGSNYTKSNQFISVDSKRSPTNTLLSNQATAGAGGAGTSPYGLGANGVNGLINTGGTTGSPNNTIIMPSLNGGKSEIKEMWPYDYVVRSRTPQSWWPGKGGKYGGGSGGNGLGGYDRYKVYQMGFGGELNTYASNMGQGDSGGDGCVRIIWGPNRSFPSSNTASP
jgi:hypothetical protein